VDAAREIGRRAAMRIEHLVALGGRPPPGTREIAGWLIDSAARSAWSAAAPDVVTQWARERPLDPAMPVPALRRAIAAPDDALAAAVASSAGLEVADGRVRASTTTASLGPAEGAVGRLEARLGEDAFAAPEAYELQDLGLGRRELAAAERAGRLLRVGEQIVLLPNAPDEAVRRLAALGRPFTAGEARAALGTTRRVAIPLLEYLDARGLTERIDATRVVRAPARPGAG
jgi:selenocysteine-specific elongation factor